MIENGPDAAGVVAGLDLIGGGVERSPELAARTAAMLWGELACPDMEADDMGKMKHVPMRLPEQMVERLDALVPLLEDDRRMEVGGEVDRAKVIRLALSIGLAQLERDTAATEAESPTRTVSTRITREPTKTRTVSTRIIRGSK